MIIGSLQDSMAVVNYSLWAPDRGVKWNNLWTLKRYRVRVRVSIKLGNAVHVWAVISTCIEDERTCDSIKQRVTLNFPLRTHRGCSGESQPSGGKISAHPGAK